MLNVTDISTQSFAGDREFAGRKLDLSYVLDLLKKQWRTAAVFAVIGLATGILYVTVATPKFTASTQIFVDPRVAKVLDSQQGASDRPVDVGIVESQVEIIKSDDVAVGAVKQLGLDKDPEFNGELRSMVGKAISSVRGLFSSPSSLSEDELHQMNAAGTVLNNTKVKRLGLSYVIEISYTALSPTKAAKVANAVADAYRVGELNSKYAATKQASSWLQDRLAELRGDAARADQAVQSFRSKNDMVSTSRGLMSEQQLADVNAQLIAGRAIAAEAKAKRDRILSVLANNQVPDATVSDALRNDVITRLRAQYLDLSARRQDLAARYGEKHAAVVNLGNQMAELRRSISDEMNRISETYKSDYEIAQTRVQSLQSSMDGLLSQNSVGGEARVQLKDLESSAQTYRTMYDSFLKKYTEATQQKTFPIGDARLISTASPPTSPSAPKTILIVPGSLAVGFMLGLGVIFFRELTKRSFESSGDVERIIGAQCLGILPVIPGRTNKGVPVDPMRFSVTAPFTRFTETLRNVKVSIDLARFTKEMNVIGITSTLPGEGKSVISANLGQVTASAGHKTLLIDADIRNNSLSTHLAKGARVGLLQVLSRQATLEAAVRIDTETGLHVLPCVVSSKVTNVPGILSSPEMQQLLAAARSKYDYVFVDFAPLGPVVDVKAASRLIDGFVYAIEYGKTSQQSVSEALGSAVEISDRIIGAILNRVDPAVLKRLESYKGDRYQNYYINDSMAA